MDNANPNQKQAAEWIADYILNHVAWDAVGTPSAKPMAQLARHLLILSGDTPESADARIADSCILEDSGQ